jgi:hypothetical protein
MSEPIKNTAASKAANARWARFRAENPDKPAGRNRQKEWREANPDRVRQYRRDYPRKFPERFAEGTRKSRLKCFYSLTTAEYDAMVKAQHGRCMICRKPMDPACVDHDHETGVVRGLLCRWCNLGIGNFKDNPKLLKIAAYYLEGKVAQLMSRKASSRKS